ncbi:MAG: hypothetical protein FWC26_08685 [Fibromonadales bacterium]|nr:hypothetical protein [Fibromonadales bacterium]
MATAMATIPNSAEIKEAMEGLGLDRWTDDLLDEIELNRRLKISLEQDDRGETMSAEEAERQIKERFANGYYTRK